METYVWESANLGSVSTTETFINDLRELQTSDFRDRDLKKNCGKIRLLSRSCH